MSPLLRTLCRCGGALYGLALRGLPAWLAGPFAAPMRVTFEAGQEDLARRGPAALARWTLAEIAAVLALALRARLRGRRLLRLKPSRRDLASGRGAGASRRRTDPGGGVADPTARVPQPPSRPPHDRPDPPRSTPEHRPMEDLLRDLRFSLRTLTRAPGFTLVAVITLALGLGVNTTIFSVVDALLLRPLPVESPEELVGIYTASPEMEHNSTSYLDYLDLRERTETLEGLAAFSNFFAGLTGQERSELVVGELVSDSYFEVLGIQTVQGRTFVPEEFETEGAHPVTILDHGFWQDRFAGDPGIVGETLRLNGRDYTVVGIAPPDFHGMLPGVEPRMWLPLSMTAQVEPFGMISSVPSPTGDTRLTRRGQRFLWLRGRLAPGATVKEARAEVSGLMAQLEEEHPRTNENLSAAVLPLEDIRYHPALDATLAPAAGLIFGIVGLVLLVACANIANMLLARAASRRREIAIRLALGARRSRLVRQLLTESLMLALLGGMAGMLLAWWSTRLLAGIRPPVSISVALDVGIDLRVFGFALVTSVVTGIAFGLMPALQATRPGLVPALEETGLGRSGRGRFELRDLLVVVQVAVSVVLLVGGALLVRSLGSVDDIDLGVDAERVGTLYVNLSMSGHEPEEAERVFGESLRRLRQIPGVEAVSTASRVPLDVNRVNSSLHIQDHPDPAEGRGITVPSTNAGLHYFRTLGLEVLQGRVFDAADVEQDRPVVVVNQAFAERFWPGESAVGKRVTTLRDRDLRIVGVVSDHKVNTLGEPPTPQVHFTFRPGEDLFGIFLVRTTGDATGMIPQLRREVLSVDPTVVFMETASLWQIVQISLLPLRLAAWLVGLFGLLTLALAAVGLYGVIGYAVSRRTREIGVRVALGAERGSVLGLVVRQGMGLVLVGVVVGALLAALGGRLLSSVLYGISALDPLAFGGAIGLLAFIALLANLVPAVRATRVDPMIAMRSE